MKQFDDLPDGVEHISSIIERVLRQIEKAARIQGIELPPKRKIKEVIHE